MDQRISLITLSVEDLDRSRRFYEAIGWEVTATEGGIVVFDLIGQTLGLYGREALAHDMGVPVAELGSGAMTLSCNVAEAADVAQVVAAMRQAGGTVLKDAHEVFWGGTTSYVRDPDGHVWEVAHNPFAPLRDDGAFRWGGYGDTTDPTEASD